MKWPRTCSRKWCSLRKNAKRTRSATGAGRRYSLVWMTMAMVIWWSSREQVAQAVTDPPDPLIDDAVETAVRARRQPQQLPDEGGAQGVFRLLVLLCFFGDQA